MFYYANRLIFSLFQTRLFVTNQIQYLKQADDVIVMDNCKISERGTYDELLKHNGAFAEFLRAHLSELQADDEEGSEIFGNLRKHSEIFPNLRKIPEIKKNKEILCTV